MKKIITLTVTLLTALCLAACSVPLKKTSTRQNRLGTAFQANAAVTLDKLQADGVIKRFGDGMWEIEFSTPNTLSGVRLSFSEGSVSASYKGLNFSVPQSALPVKAMMLNLIRAVDDNARLDELKGEEKDDTLEISGKLDGGDYTLIVDKDGNLSGFNMPNNKLTVTFTDLTELSSSAEPTTESATSETTAATETTEAASADENA